MLSIDVKVKKFLLDLGRGPNKIAENLEKKKIKGHIGDSRRCPIVNVIKKKFKQINGINVGYEVIFDHNHTEYEFNTPEFIKKFINKFDNGSYPKLVTG